MISFNPTLVVRRLYVLRNKLPVMDIYFKTGLNIIAGENSSGKTTAIRFLAYALGAENIKFNPAALTCDEIYVEVEANNAVVTLRRFVSEQIMQPMDIFWGTTSDSLVVPASSWERYPFKISESKRSFSQVLFKLLDLPELKGESGANITMHQLLRLAYSDQETPGDEIFRHDKFDKAITRAAIGDYLLGIDSSELYELKLKESNLDKDASGIRSSIKTIYSTFGQSGTNISLEFIESQVASLDSEVRFLQQKLQTLSVKRGASASKEDQALLTKLDTANRRLSEQRARKHELEAEIADSDLFLKELEERLHSLEESSVAESYLGTAIFSFCPSCFSKINKSEFHNTCALCKSPKAEDSARTQLARMRNELSLQLRESESIRVQQLDEVDAITRELPGLTNHLKALEQDYRRNQAQWRSPEEIEAQSISREIGAKEQAIKNTLELKKLADLLKTLTGKLSELETELIYVRGRIEAVVREQSNRRKAAYNLVAEEFKKILKLDLARQTEFAAAEDVSIDFGANRVYIDGHNQFSASSMVFYRHSFHLALLMASLKNKNFRYPRFLILDGVEDGGMEVERSYNFQNIIQAYSDESSVEHQIIMTTMNPSPKLDSPDYIVVRKFDHERKSILPIDTSMS